MPKSIIRAYRVLLDVPAAPDYGDRLDHNRCKLNPRSAEDHRRAHQECLSEGLEGCPYCA